MRKHIPNMITSCNLLCGAGATYLATEGEFMLAFLLIILAAIFDFFDGFTARLLHVSSPIGKELDSLADNITFGLAPTMMLFCFLFPLVGWWAVIVFLMAAFSALRLAKFNIDERQTTSFIGLATPANAIFWGSLICAATTFDIVIPKWILMLLIVASLFSCYLLIAEIPMFSLKFKNASWESNKIQYIFLIGAGIIIVSLGLLSFWDTTMIFHAGYIVMLWYIILSLIDNITKK